MTPKAPVYLSSACWNSSCSYSPNLYQWVPVIGRSVLSINKKHKMLISASDNDERRLIPWPSFFIVAIFFEDIDVIFIFILYICYNYGKLYQRIYLIKTVIYCTGKIVSKTSRSLLI